MINNEKIFSIIFLIFLIWVFITYIISNIKYNKFISRLKIGTILQNTLYDINNEFDPGYTFTITIMQVGERQVKVCYSDGSYRIMDKFTLYYEKWKIIKE